MLSDSNGSTANGLVVAVLCWYVERTVRCTLLLLSTASIQRPLQSFILCCFTLTHSASTLTPLSYHTVTHVMNEPQYASSSPLNLHQMHH